MIVKLITFFKSPILYATLLGLCGSFLFVILQTGCIGAPNRKDYKYEACFASQACLYRAQKKKDSVICKNDSDDCSKDREMGRKERVVKRCKDPKNRPKEWTFGHCKDFYLSGSSK